MGIFFPRKTAKERNWRIKYRGRPHELDPRHADKLPTFVFASRNPLTRIYTWGMASYGALGVPEFVRPKMNPRYRGVKKHEALATMKRPARCSYAETQRVVDVACGYGFTVFAVDAKKTNWNLMGTGINRDGQFGYFSPRAGDNPLGMVIRPAGIKLPIDENAKVTSVAAGRAHSLALTDQGDVFSLGNNGYGQCGRRIVPNEDYARNRPPHKINVKDDIVAIHCGKDHSLLRKSEGRLLTFGWGSDGQLGRGDYESRSDLDYVNGELEGEKVVKVATSADCVLALTGTYLIN